MIICSVVRTTYQIERQRVVLVRTPDQQFVGSQAQYLWNPLSRLPPPQVELGGQFAAVVPSEIL